MTQSGVHSSDNNSSSTTGAADAVSSTSNRELLMLADALTRHGASPSLITRAKKGHAAVPRLPLPQALEGFDLKQPRASSKGHVTPRTGGRAARAPMPAHFVAPPSARVSVDTTISTTSSIAPAPAPAPAPAAVPTTAHDEEDDDDHNNMLAPPPRYPWEELLERERRKRLGMPGGETPEDSESEEEHEQVVDDETDAAKHVLSGRTGAAYSTVEAEMAAAAASIRNLGLSHAERQALWYTRHRPAWHSMRGTVASDIRDALARDQRVQARITPPPTSNPYRTDVLASPRYRPRVVAASVEATGSFHDWNTAAGGALTERRMMSEEQERAQARREAEAEARLRAWRQSKREELDDALLSYEARRMVEEQYARDVTRYVNSIASDRLHDFNRAREEKLAKAKALKHIRLERGGGMMSFGMDLPPSMRPTRRW